MFATLSLYNTVGNEGTAEKYHSRHLGILETFDRESNPLCKALVSPMGNNIPQSREKIDKLKRWRKRHKSGLRTPGREDGGSHRRFRSFQRFIETSNGVVEAFVICVKDSMLRKKYDIIRHVVSPGINTKCESHARGCEYR